MEFEDDGLELAPGTWPWILCRSAAMLAESETAMSLYRKWNSIESGLQDGLPVEQIRSGWIALLFGRFDGSCESDGPSPSPPIVFVMRIIMDGKKREKRSCWVKGR